LSKKKSRKETGCHQEQRQKQGYTEISIKWMDICCPTGNPFKVLDKHSVSSLKDVGREIDNKSSLEGFVERCQTKLGGVLNQSINNSIPRSIVVQRAPLLVLAWQNHCG
jgi:hypothetical protein